MDDQNKTNPLPVGTTPVVPKPNSDGTTAAATTTPASDSPSFAVPEITNVPPPPIAEAPKDSTSDTTDVPKGPPAGGSAADPTIPTVITTSGGKPKNKGGKKKTVATILGLLLLVGSVGIGTILVQRNQDIRERADEEFCSDLTNPTQCANGIGGSQCIWNVCDGIPSQTCDQTLGCYFAVFSQKCKSLLNDSEGWCQDDPNQPPPPPPAPTDGSVGCGLTDEGTNSSGQYTYKCGGSCSGGKTCKKAGTTNLGGGVLQGICKCLSTGGGDNRTAEPTSTPIGTAPPGLTAQCLNIKAFDTEFNQLDIVDLTTLQSGDSVIFTVAGTATSGIFTGARFTINGTTRPVVTETRPGTEEFMDTVVLPDGTSLTVEAELQHSEAGFF